MFSLASQIIRVAVVGLFALVGAYSFALGQPAAESGTSQLGAAQVDRLVAPIALYPDPLIAQILMAATYPLEIVQADRWLQNPSNAALKGDALAAELQNQPWDPSVKSLVQFPQILRLMDSNLDWTEQLGNAFLAQQADVMDSVQRLRQRARAAGSLASTPQQTVSTEDQDIMIEPASPDIIYVPAYNPWCIYGDWPYSEYPPFYFGGGGCPPASFIDFGVGIYPAFGFWAWAHFEWRHHNIRVDRVRFRRFHSGRELPDEIWQHDPAHRHDVPYPNPETMARFQGAATAAEREHRGFAPLEFVPPGKPAVPSSGQPAIVRPGGNPITPPRPVPPAFESLGRGSQVRGEAARGFSSRTAPVAPPPSFHGAPMGGFFGGAGRR